MASDTVHKCQEGGAQGGQQTPWLRPRGWRRGEGASATAPQRGGTRLLQRPGLCRWRGPWGLVLFSGGHRAPHALVLLCPSFLLTAVCSERYWGHRGDTSQEGGTPPSRGHLGSGSGLGLATSSSLSCGSDLPVCWLPGSEPGGALTAPRLPSLSPGAHLSGRPPSPLAG